jgi:branched-chain amino acid aminotransferase
MTLWLNGALCASAEARIDPADRGLTLGDGLFETICVAAERPMHLTRHLTRLRDGARLLAIPVPYDDATLAAAIHAVVAANRLADAAVRLTLTRGPAPRGVLPPDSPTPTVLITAGPLPAAGPVRLVVSTVTRRNESSPLSRIKSLNYLDSVLARLEAARRGADDALLLNSRGAIAEATTANLFLRSGGRLVTPPVTDGALPGVMRAMLIERCGAEERTLFPADVRAADITFLSNSAGLRAVVALEGDLLRCDATDLAGLVSTVAAINCAHAPFAVWTTS